jgi:hypothetical protein
MIVLDSCPTQAITSYLKDENDSIYDGYFPTLTEGPTCPHPSFHPSRHYLFKHALIHPVIHNSSLDLVFFKSGCSETR